MKTRRRADRRGEIFEYWMFSKKSKGASSGGYCMEMGLRGLGLREVRKKSCPGISSGLRSR